MSLSDFGSRGQRIWLSIMFGIVGFAVFTHDGAYGSEPIGWTIITLALMSVAYQTGRVVEREYIERHKWDPESKVWKQTNRDIE